jgi:hypothetical protein
MNEKEPALTAFYEYSRPNRNSRATTISTYCSSLISVSSVFHPWLRESFWIFAPFVSFCSILLRRWYSARTAERTVFHHGRIKLNQS